MKHVIGQSLTHHQLQQRAWKSTPAILFMLALLIIGASVAACSSPSTQNPGSTATPTRSATSAAQQLYGQVTSKQPDISDPLSAGSSFMEQYPPDCTYSNGSLHVQDTKPRYYIWCIAKSITVSNFAVQVQMTNVSGDMGGIMFRIDNAAAKYYRFEIGQNGTYSLHLSTSLSTAEQILLSGSSPAIKTGHGQANMVTVIANGNSLSFFVNQQFIASKSDTTLAGGNIGFIADSTNNPPTTIAFSNVQIWKM